MQDDGGITNGGVDLDQTPNTMTVNVTAVNDAPAGTSNTVSTLEDTRIHLRQRCDFGFSDRRRQLRPTRCAAVKITTLPGAGSLTDNGVAVSAGQSSSALADIAGGKLDVHPGGQRQRGGLRELHLPGAGRRRHRQRRRGSRSNAANTMSIDVTAVNDAPAGTDNTVTTLEDTRIHLRQRRLRLQRRSRQLRPTR